jgi:hypothetical protein
MPDVAGDDIDSWRRFFAATNLSIGVETAGAWIHDRNELAGPIAEFVAALIEALERLGARVTRRETAMHQDFLPRAVPPDAFLFSHHSIGEGPAICRYKHSYRRGYFGCDPWGYSGFSRLARDPAMLEAAWALPAAGARRYADELCVRQLSDNASKFRQPPLTLPAPEPGYVLLALQVLRDTVMRLARDEPLAFYRRVVDECVRAGRRLVIKRHPRCSDPATAAFLADVASHPLVTIHENSVNQLLPAAERVVVINSGVGLESLIHGRPTLTFGASEYAPLTTQIADCEAVAAALTSPPAFDELRVARFLWWYFERYCVRSDDLPAILTRVRECLAGLPPRHGWRLRDGPAPGVWKV